MNIYNSEVLGAFGNLRKATISCLSVRPSFRLHGKIGLSLGGFSSNLIFQCFRKSVEKIKVSLRSYKNNGTLHENLCTFMIISR